MPTTTVLEDFLRDCVETRGGAWDEVEPQVYDLLLADGGESSVVRVAFDPEAVPEHPGAQLASFGTPFVDRLLQDALRRGRAAQFYLVGLNLSPHDLAGKVRRQFTLAAPWRIHVERARALHFAQAVFWFQAEFASDRKEQEIIPVGMDLHYGREVRHLDELLNPSRLAEEPALPLPEARRQSLPAASRLARNEVLRSFAALANARGRELTDRCDLQIERMAQYYADLRAELEEPARRAKEGDESAARLAARRQAVDREEQLRVAELRHKSALRVHLRLLQLLIVQQPKLLLHATGSAPGKPAVPVELVWDPLMETLEAFPCSNCTRPTFALDVNRQGQPVCPDCIPRPIRRS